MMKVAYFTALRKLQIADAPLPAIQRPGDVLVRIDRVGVCGSDVHYYVHGRIGNQIVEYPATLGHECSGTVMEVGVGQVGNLPHEKLQPGTRVAIDPALVCGQCDQCRAGRQNTCRNIQFLGSPGQAPGAVAEYHVLPAENCVPIPDDLSLDAAVLAEPLSVGLYAVRSSPLGDCPSFCVSKNGTVPFCRDRPTSEGTATPSGRKTDQSPASIAILGAGPIGLSVLLCAKAEAACKVYMTDLLDERLAVARACGADWTQNARREEGDSPVSADTKTGTVPSIREQEPLGLDVVFECSGDPTCIDRAQRLLKPGGTLMLVGIPPTVEVQYDAHLMRTKELTFRAVRRQNECVAPVIDLLHSGRIDAAPLLTHRFPLERIRDAFELVAGYRDGVIKAVVDVSGAEG